MSEKKMVKIYSLSDANKAELLKNLLLDHGIECHLDGEHQAGFTGMTPFEIGVLVSSDNEQEARDIMHQHHADEE
ncbi:MAG: DUF2007 domain-containing protein [Planctomycetales bacterium]|nr:DUF2007 domain-containing protein [Planctomycetales bacterium]